MQPIVNKSLVLSRAELAALPAAAAAAAPGCLANTMEDLFKILIDKKLLFNEGEINEAFKKYVDNLTGDSRERLNEILLRKMEIQCENGTKSGSIFNLLKNFLVQNNLADAEVTIVGSYVVKILGWSFVEQVFRDYNLPLQEYCTPELLAKLKNKFEIEPHDIDIRIALPKGYSYVERFKLQTKFKQYLNTYLGGMPVCKPDDNISGEDQYLSLGIGAQGGTRCEFCFYEKLVKRNLCSSDAFQLTLSKDFFTKSLFSNTGVIIQTGKTPFLKALLDILSDQITLFEPDGLNPHVLPRLIQMVAQGKKADRKKTLDPALFAILLSTKSSKGKFLGRLLLKRWNNGSLNEKFAMTRIAEETMRENIGTLGLTADEIEKMKKTMLPDRLHEVFYSCSHDEKQLRAELHRLLVEERENSLLHSPFLQEAMASKKTTLLRFCEELVESGYIKLAWTLYQEMGPQELSRAQFLKRVMEIGGESSTQEILSLLVESGMTVEDRREALLYFFENPPSKKCHLDPLLITEGLELLIDKPCEEIKKCDWFYKLLIQETEKRTFQFPSALLGDVMNRYPELCKPYIDRILPLIQNKTFAIEDPLKVLGVFRGTYVFFKIAALIEKPSKEIAELIFEEFSQTYAAIASDPESLQVAQRVLYKIAPLIDPNKLIDEMSRWKGTEEKKALLMQERERLENRPEAVLCAALCFNDKPFPLDLFKVYPSCEVTHWNRALEEAKNKSSRDALWSMYSESFEKNPIKGPVDKVRALFLHFIESAMTQKIAKLSEEDIRSHLPEIGDKSYKPAAEKVLKTLISMMHTKKEIDRYFSLVCELCQNLENSALPLLSLIPQMDFNQVCSLLELSQPQDLVWMESCKKLFKLNTVESKAHFIHCLDLVKHRPGILLELIEFIQHDTEFFMEVLIGEKFIALKEVKAFRARVRPLVDLHYKKLENCETLRPFFESLTGYPIKCRYAAQEALIEIERLVDENMAQGRPVSFSFPFIEKDAAIYLPIFLKKCIERLDNIEKSSVENRAEKVRIYTELIELYIGFGDCSLKPTSDLYKAYKKILHQLNSVPQDPSLERAHIHLFQIMTRAVLGKQDFKQNTPLDHFIECIAAEECCFREYTPPNPAALQKMPLPFILLPSFKGKTKEYYDHLFYLLDLLLEEAKTCHPEIRFQYVELIGQQIRHGIIDVFDREKHFDLELFKKLAVRLEAFMALPNRDISEFCKKKLMVATIFKYYTNDRARGDVIEHLMPLHMINVRSLTGEAQIHPTLREAHKLKISINSKAFLKHFDDLADAQMKAFLAKKIPADVAFIKMCSLLCSLSVACSAQESVLKLKKKWVHLLYEKIIPASAKGLSSPLFVMMDLLAALQVTHIEGGSICMGVVKLSFEEHRFLEEFPAQFLTAINMIPTDMRGDIPPQYFDIRYLALQTLLYNATILHYYESHDSSGSISSSLSSLERLFKEPERYKFQHQILVESFSKFAFKTPLKNEAYARLKKVMDDSPLSAEDKDLLEKSMAAVFLTTLAQTK